MKRVIGAFFSVIASVAATMAMTPPPAGAFAIGVSTQSPPAFASPLWRDLGIRRTRYVTPWDGVMHAPSRAQLDAYLNAARASGVEVLVAFNHSQGQQCPRAPCSAPSVAAYTRAFRAFRARYPWVRLIQPWNEVNNPTQPTYRRPDLTAAYYKVVTRYCRGCTVPAADLQDVSNFKPYLRRFLRALGGLRPRLWGLHNYTSINRFRTDGTKLALRLLPGRIWVTETGGIYTFRAGSGVIVFPPSANRAARATSYMLQVALRYRARMPRLYIYEWDPDPTGHFDSGLLDLNGKPRQSYSILARYKRFID